MQDKCVQICCQLNHCHGICAFFGETQKACTPLANPPETTGSNKPLVIHVTAEPDTDVNAADVNLNVRLKIISYVFVNKTHKALMTFEKKRFKVKNSF